MKKLPAFLSSACAAALLLAAVATTRAEAPTVGSAAPDFALTDSSGKTHKLSEYKGKYVVLEWTNPGCPFVRKHYDAGNMQKLQAEYVKKGVVWLAVDSSAPGKEGYLEGESAKKAKDGDYAAASALLLDPDGKTGHLYGATNTPHMYIVDPEGKLVYSGAIDSVASADKSDIAKATNYVRAALDEALTGKPITKTSSKAYGCSVKYKG